MHLRQNLADLVPFLRTVVKEHKRIEAQIQLFRQTRQVFSLIFPVNPPAGEVALAQNHRWMFFNYRKSKPLFVFAADGEQNAARSQALEDLLKCMKALANRIWRAKLDVLRAIVAHYATPECVIQIADNHFLALTE